MKKVLIATEKPFAKSALKKILKVFAKSGYEVSLLENYKTKQELLSAVENTEALIIRSDNVDEEVLESAKKLKIVVRAGAGYDNVDLKAAKEKGIVVMNTPGQNANAVAEYAIGLAIFGLREMFSGKSGGEMRGRTLGLHGFGFVARNVFRIARSMGMKVIVYTRYSRDAAASIGLKVTDSLEELYHKSDIVSIHVPALGEHVKSVGYEVLNQLKDGSIIINTARKEVINESDLMQIMEEKTKIKYLSDVSPDALVDFQEKFKGRVYFSPKKAGAQTEEANTNAGIAAAEQIVAYFNHGDVGCQVNK